MPDAKAMSLIGTPQVAAAAAALLAAAEPSTGAPVGSPYPPASSGPGPFSGQPVSGPPDATGMHVHGMDMAHGSTVPVAPAISNEPCRCSIGWVLFAVSLPFAVTCVT